MANYSDLDEFGIMPFDAEDSVTICFNNAAEHLKKLVSSLDNNTLLTLYAYYKQGTEGKCNVPEPSWYDVRGKSKWKAWNILGDFPMEEAKRLYIQKIKQIDPTFDETNGITPNKDYWVKVSTLQNKSPMDFTKSITDYIKEGNVQEVEAHLKTPTFEDINKLDNDGLALLHWSADSGSVEVMKLIVASGANIDLQDSEGQTALHYASSCGHLDCIKLLLSCSARTDVLDNDGLSPIMVAFDQTVKNMLLPL